MFHHRAEGVLQAAIPTSIYLYSTRENLDSHNKFEESMQLLLLLFFFFLRGH